MTTTLILVPSEIEFQLLWGDAPGEPLEGPFKAWKRGSQILAVSGIGAMASAHSAGLLIRDLKPNRVILVGIAGAFPQSNLQLEDVVQISDDHLVDLGYEQAGRLIGLDEMDLSLLSGRHGEFGAAYKVKCLDRNWPRVKSITVNRMTASEVRADQLWHQFGAAIEQMEGAGVALACAFAKVDYYHVRAISNAVGPRKPASWRIGPACDALKEWLLKRL